MANTRKNSTLMKIIVTALSALLVSSIIWIWNAAGICKDVQANTKICEAISPRVESNTIAITSVGKDIERIDEKVDRIDSSQQQMITLQREIIREIKSP